MSGFLPIPNLDRVKDAARKFDKENAVIEEALEELFGHYHPNTNPSHVLLKVVALNRLYSAGVLAVEAVAQHIFNNGERIDTALAAGDPSVVDLIARVTFRGKPFNFFSFATKYCSWHRLDVYPIYDSRVDRYLWSLQLHSRFSEFEDRADIRKDFASFFEIMMDLRRFYKLEPLSFKEIDKFLWSQIESSTAPERAPSVAGQATEQDAKLAGGCSDE